MGRLGNIKFPGKRLFSKGEESSKSGAGGSNYPTVEACLAAQAAISRDNPTSPSTHSGNDLSSQYTVPGSRGSPPPKNTRTCTGNEPPSQHSGVRSGNNTASQYTGLSSGSGLGPLGNDLDPHTSISEPGGSSVVTESARSPSLAETGTNSALKHELPLQRPPPDDKTTTASDDKSTLVRISNHILEAAQDHPALRGTRSRDPEGAVVHVIGKYKALGKNVEEVQRDLERLEPVQGELKAAKNDLQVYKNELLSCEYNLDRTKEENKALKVRVSKLSSEKSTLQHTHSIEIQGIEGKHAQEVARLKATITQFEFEKDDLNRIHRTELQRERESHQSEIAQTKAKYEEKLRKASENAAKERWNIGWQHKEATEALKGSFAGEIKQLNQKLQWTRKDFDQQLAAEKGKHQVEKDRLEDEIARLISSAKEEKAQMRKSFRDKEDQLKKDFEAQSVGLKIENEELKGALVARDHSRSLTDPELASRFEILASQVGEFSRIRWDTGREAYWPFPERTLQQLHRENTRKLKQQIVQSSIWVILYDNIFYSPFQVFGEEGKVLNREWTEAFGRSQSSTAAPHWPEPTQDSEQQRCNTIKLCLQSLEQAEDAPGVDLRRKQGYDQSVATIVEEISQAVEKLFCLIQVEMY
ncbi:uncharacterized protein K441DRAFT_701266 [Cenococcum geophilum 1.58]|uniref:Uncharacterized protein n=1 Tax=Cenococcum geophilum 1.58 TaxID=794803 RepID=A0ACC8EMD2_9PEZI|nr:hypothetical protein K441DRAFT_701266 [Cenococcum geophilum 1.58]